MRQSVYKARCLPWGLIWLTEPGELLGRETKSGSVAEVAQLSRRVEALSMGPLAEGF